VLGGAALAVQLGMLAEFLAVPGSSMQTGCMVLPDRRQETHVGECTYGGAAASGTDEPLQPALAFNLLPLQPGRKAAAGICLGPWCKCFKSAGWHSLAAALGWLVWIATSKRGPA
jgi:hypothetical protein